jgi:hypothetical protein
MFRYDERHTADNFKFVNVRAVTDKKHEVVVIAIEECVSVRAALAAFLRTCEHHTLLEQADEARSMWSRD